MNINLQPQMIPSLRQELYKTVWVVASDKTPRQQVVNIVTEPVIAIVSKHLGLVDYPLVLCKKYAQAKRLSQYFRDNYIDTKIYKISWVL